jgi:hypothetical protein
MIFNLNAYVSPETCERILARGPVIRNGVLSEVAERIVSEFELRDGRELTVREILRLVHSLKVPVV